MTYLYLAQLHRLREEAAHALREARTQQLQEEAAGSLRATGAGYESEDCESESSVDEYEDTDDEDARQYNPSDFPARFLGTAISRQQTQVQQQQTMVPRPCLHVNTTASNIKTGGADTADNYDDNNVARPRLSPNQNTGPISPWRNCSAKTTIISNLKDSSSDIHLHIGSYGPNNWTQVKFKPIWETYASQYSLSNFKGNLKRLLIHFQNGTGNFEDEAANIEPWYTSVSKVSKAYSLLFSLYMDCEKSRLLNDMTVEKIWESHPQFQQYELDKFKAYNRNMKLLTNKRRDLIGKEEAMFRRDIRALPKCARTSRGIPFWNEHAASRLLENDEETGIAKSMAPKILWESREEYQDFPLSVFRKHIYQERSKQLSAPCWQYKRNQKAQKKHLEEVQKLKEEWHQVQFGAKINDMIDDWDKLNLNGN